MSLRGSLCAAASFALIAAGLVTASPPASAAPEPDSPTDLPEPGSEDSQWQTWATDDRADAASHDWAADSAARGCELIEIEITEEVDALYNESLGAPADLATVRVDRLEECEQDATQQQEHTTAEAAPTAVPPGPSRCNSGTKGPGTICISSSGGWVNASWQYRGSGSVSGFLRVYQISTGATGCPTGTTWLTSPTMTWNSGQTRTTSKSRSQSGAYSAHIWRSTSIGSTTWGSTCARL